MSDYRCRCGERELTEVDDLLICDSCGQAYRKPDDYHPEWDPQNY